MTIKRQVFNIASNQPSAGDTGNPVWTSDWA